MKQVANDNQEPTIVRHAYHNWIHDKHALDQGAYYLAEPGGTKFAVILPKDRNRPIEIPEQNALLCLREFGTENWRNFGPYTLTDALTKGSQYADVFRRVWIARELNIPVRSERTKEEKSREPERER